jgi:ribosome-associated toxin RatA of RatAB toxin-antitoxin module
MGRFIFICLFILCQVPDSDWSLRKNKSGIEVYTRSVEGSSFREFKGKTVIKNAGLIKILDVIMDIKNYESLIPDCMNPRILEQDGKYHVIQYTQTKTPFPVKNRDSIFEQSAEIDNNGKHARVVLKPLPEYIAETKEMVRIRKGTGFWDLEADENGNVSVTYQFHGDPGGDIPSWLANSFVVTHPFKTLENLKNRVAN